MCKGAGVYVARCKLASCGSAWRQKNHAVAGVPSPVYAGRGAKLHALYRTRRRPCGQTARFAWLHGKCTAGCCILSCCSLLRMRAHSWDGKKASVGPMLSLREGGVQPGRVSSALTVQRLSFLVAMEPSDRPR